MTLLERLQNHRGGLVRIKSELAWYSARGWDGSPGRICLVLDADALTHAHGAVAAVAVAALPAAGTTPSALVIATTTAAAHLLVDGSPHWIWVSEADIEILDGGDQ